MPTDISFPQVRDTLYHEGRQAGLPVIFTIGDSWFDYPFYYNIIDNLYFTGLYAFWRQEVVGATMTQILAQASLPHDVLEKGGDVLLVSGGGNDLVEKPWIRGLFQLDSNQPVELLINRTYWQRKLDEIQSQYLDIIMRCKVAGVRVVTHGYGYLVPSSDGVKFDAGFYKTGPWVLPAMTAAGITTSARQRAVAHIIIDDFNAMLDGLVAQGHVVSNGKPAFVHVDCRPALGPTDWANEMHPTKTGFEELAAYFVPVLNSLV